MCKALASCRWHSVESPSLHAVSLETVRPVKYDVASLTDFVRNTSCAHVCVVVDGDSVFLNVCATRGRARDLLRSGHSGPKTIADLMAAIVPRAHALRNSSQVVGGWVLFFL